MQKNLISCIIASYNTEPEYLVEAVNSMLQQTYDDFEIIIVDDGSEFPVKKALAGIRDERIVILENETNLGVTFSRNRAMQQMRGEFMAVMDADDVCDVQRFEKQVSYLRKHPECDLVSCQMAFMATDGRKDPWLKIPRTTPELLARLFWDNSKPFPHGAALIRTEFLRKNNITYDMRYKKALDYRLWVDCARFGGKFHILDEYMYFYRVHAGQISQKSRDSQMYYADRICLDQLEYLNLEPSEQETQTHLALRDSECAYTVTDTFVWKEKLLSANKKLGYCKHSVFRREINYRFFKMCYKEYIMHRNKVFRSHFFRSLSIYNIFRSVKAIIENRIDTKHPKTLKV